MCFGIAKLWCLSLHKWVFFSLSYMPMHAMLKKKTMQRKTKAKRIKMLLNMIASVFLEDVGVIGCTLKVIVPIKLLWLCVNVFDFSHISNRHNMRHLCTLAMFHTQYANSLLLLIHLEVQCDLAIIRDTYVNKCSLNCFNLFLKYKIS